MSRGDFVRIPLITRVGGTGWCQVSIFHIVGYSIAGVCTARTSAFCNFFKRCGIAVMTPLWCDRGLSDAWKIWNSVIIILFTNEIVTKWKVYKENIRLPMVYMTHTILLYGTPKLSGVFMKWSNTIFYVMHFYNIRWQRRYIK